MASNEQVGNIVYQVQMDVAELIEAQRKVNDRLDKMGGNFDRASASASRFEGALNKVGIAIASAITIDTAKKLIAIGDEMATLQARVTRLSPSVDVAKESMSSLSAIASETGGSLVETEKLWESLTTSLKSTGATNSQILQLTSTLQKIGTIGGSSAEEMSNALRQFGQSMSRGTIQAEEFNSIVEQMPELARQMAAGLGISTDQLRQKMLDGKLTAQDALNAIQKQTEYVNAEFEKMPVNVDRAKNSLDVAFRNAINDLNQAIGLTSTLAGLMQSVADNLNYYNNNAGDSSRMPKLIKLQQELNEEIKDGQRWYESDTIFQQRRAQAAFQLKQVEGEIAHIRAKASKDADNNQFNAPSTKGDDAATSKLVKNSERRLALAKLEGEARARLQAQYDAADAGINDQKRIKALQDEYAETYRVTEARKESNKEGKTSASQAESIAQKLASLKQQSELAAESTSELSREQAMLRAEQSLGSAASQAQIKEAREYAARTWDVANALKMRQQAEQASRFINQEVASSKVQRDPYTGEAQDPAAQVNEEEQRKLEALAKYRELGVINAQQYEDGKTAIARQASNDRVSIAQQEAKRQVDVMNMLLGGIGEGFSGLAEIVSKSAGESNAAYKTLFAISKAFAVAQSTLNLQLALSNAMASGPFPWNMAAMAQVAAAGGQVISSIGAMSYGGGREHGGPVSANSMYRVGEGGKPEIFKASNGSQYMIPGDNGRVISNRDMGGGGGGFNYSPTIQINGNPDEKTIALVEAAVARGGKQVYQQISGDLASGKGNVSKGLQSGWTAKRRIG
ncbi:tape measure protein [Escherichia coli]|nr:tape measure protein [Escherichia coli]